MDRNALLLGDATPATRIIEIGPSHAPIAPKRGGWNSFVVDHADQAELRAKYDKFGVDLEAIEPVDGVWHGGRLDSAVPPALHGSFDRLIASHVIEHIPDIVTFLNSAQNLLAGAGTLALAVPDKRYCFDALKPITTTGDILAAHAPDGPGRHSRRTLFNQVAYSVGMDGASAWGQHPVHAAHFMNSLTDALAFHEAASEAPDSPYVDAHAWQFTPAAFQLAILELAEAGLIDWRVAECSPAQGSEFIVTLRRGRTAWPEPAQREARRMELLLATLVEQREQIDYAALGGLIAIPAQAADPAIARSIADLRAALATQDARMAAIATALAPPTDQPASLGTLADLTARLDAQQRQLATITAADGTQASIMASLAQLDARQNAQAQAISDLGARLDAQHAQLASITAADGTQASIMGSLAQIATRQQDAADHAAAGAARAAEPMLQALAGLAARLDAQQRRLDEVHRVSTWLSRSLRPARRLRARLLGRPFTE